MQSGGVALNDTRQRNHLDLSICTFTFLLHNNRVNYYVLTNSSNVISDDWRLGMCAKQASQDPALSERSLPKPSRVYENHKPVLGTKPTGFFTLVIFMYCFRPAASATEPANN